MNQTATAVLAAITLAACTHLPDTPIGNYPVGPVMQQPAQGLTYRCTNGGTEVTVRGAKNPDPQACNLIKRI